MDTNPMKLLTVNSAFHHKVSSVLNRSAEYASKHMFDGRPDSCWNSDQGATQHIIFDFCRPVEVILLRIMFQGGFAGLNASIDVGDSVDSLKCISILNDIEDINEMQEFRIRDYKYTVDDDTSASPIVPNTLIENNTLITSGKKVEDKGDNDCKTKSQEISERNNSINHHFRYMRIKFTSSADFYGRVTIYNFEVHGTE